MNRLRASFANLQAHHRKALLPYITAGFPDVATTLEILKRVDPRRCACVELGIPFSDPIADGPVIQASFAAALARGFRVNDLLAGLRSVRGEIAVPLVAMVSHSIVYRRGVADFLASAVAAGIDGLIVPDLSFEEADALAAAGHAADCPLVLMVAPTTSPARRERIAALSDPFIYYQSMAGVTGERDQLPPELADSVRRLRTQADKPVCVGFGIARPAQVATVCEFADGAIVGSAIVRRINDAVRRDYGTAELVDLIGGYIDELCAALPG